MGAALARGMVLTMSIWDDHDANALWLDSSYPATADPSKPGVARGPCATTSGVPKDVEAQVPNSSVTFSNIKWGELDSTYTGSAGSTTVGPTGSVSSTSKPVTTPSSTPTGCLSPKVCLSRVCNEIGDKYECLPVSTVRRTGLERVSLHHQLICAYPNPLPTVARDVPLALRVPTPTLVSLFDPRSIIVGYPNTLFPLDYSQCL